MEVTASPFATLQVAVDGALGHLTLDRPARLNALSREVLAELAAAARWFDDHDDVTVVVVAGAGPTFCAGFDLNDFGRVESGGKDGGVLGAEMADAIEAMRAVTVAAIQGHCVGGGVVLASACDLRVAGTGTTFSIPEVDLGIPLAWGGIPRLVRELGPAVTKDLVLTCRAFSGAEALTLRFVNRVVADDEIGAEAERLATGLAAKSPLTLSVTKRQVHAAVEEMASTAQSFRDADMLNAALRDPASQAVGAAYLERRRARPSNTLR